MKIARWGAGRTRAPALVTAAILRSNIIVRMFGGRPPPPMWHARQSRGYNGRGLIGRKGEHRHGPDCTAAPIAGDTQSAIFA